MELLSSFGKYLYSEEKIEKLKSNLDQATLQKLDRIFSKIKLLSSHNILNFNLVYDKLDRQDLKKLSKYIKTHKKLPFPMNAYYLHKTKIDYNFNIQGKDILDIGACDGDSSINFSNIYKGSKVYGFEPDPKNFEKFQNNIKKYGNDNILPIKYGASNFEGKAKIEGIGGCAKIGGNSGEEIEITTIDKFVLDNDLHPAIIKRDIEGAEYNSILGSKQTIEKYKPILFVSIYHTGKDFFEIKPLIESRNLKYKFGIDKRNSHPFIDTVLICY